MVFLYTCFMLSLFVSMIFFFAFCFPPNGHKICVVFQNLHVLTTAAVGMERTPLLCFVLWQTCAADYGNSARLVMPGHSFDISRPIFSDASLRNGPLPCVIQKKSTDERLSGRTATIIF